MTDTWAFLIAAWALFAVGAIAGWHVEGYGPALMCQLAGAICLAVSIVTVITA